MPVTNDWTRISFFFQGILFIYYQVIEWVDLFPWNDIRRGNGQESLDLIVALVLGIFIMATWRRLRWVMTVGIGLYGLWVWLQIDSWWVPYLRGASPAWKRTYDRFFSETINFLPSDGIHLSPDACHMLLQVLILGSFITISLAVFQLFFKSNRE